VLLFDFDRGEAQLIAGYAKDVSLPASGLPMTDFLPGEALRTGGIRYIEDLSSLEDPPPHYRELLAERVRSVLSVPLLVEGETIGEIYLGSPTPAGFSPEHREIALEIATPLAIAIQQARLREELARQTGELERRLAERSAAIRAATAELETVLHSVSHDLRTPLRQLLGFSRLLLDEGGLELDPALRHYAESIQQSADRMTTLIDDLISLSRIGRQDLLRREVPLTPLVEDVVNQFRSSADGRTIDWQIEELPVVECDPALAKIAVTNLISNAVKFTRVRERATIRIRPVETDGQVGLAVEDNGVGFKMAYAGKLFGLFQRLHREDEFEGNGAGLALVHRIAHKHGGRVWAEAEPDAGATFYLTLGSGKAGKRGSSVADRDKSAV
jgi:signal transduction histidine kinase